MGHGGASSGSYRKPPCGRPREHAGDLRLGERPAVARLGADRSTTQVAAELDIAPSTVVRARRTASSHCPSRSSPTMKYGLLRQRNPAYAQERWEELGDLYVGGYALVDKASRYMPKFVGESRERYRERLSAASYLAYMGQIADYFVANLFSQELTLTQAADAKDPTTPGAPASDDGFWNAFAHDADLRGTSFVKLLRQVLTT